MSDQLVDRLRVAGCVFAEEEAEVLRSSAVDEADLERMVREREAGTPLEQVVGWVDFAGVRVRTAPNVFVPRRRSELLVREALRGLTDAATGVDLCCGTGAIGLAVLEAASTTVLHAVDLDPAAVACARTNLGARAQVHGGDLYAALPHALRGQVDVIVCCPPYVPTGALGSMPAEARDFEPAVALDGGDDGLDVVRRVVADGPGWLRPGGRLILETSEPQVVAVSQAIEAAGLRDQVARDDEIGAVAVIAVAAP